MTSATALRVRVWVTPVWDVVEVEASPSWRVAELKAHALEAAGVGKTAPLDHIVKFRGAQVFDETQTLEQLGAPDGAPFVVLPSRRQPVR